MMTSTPLLHVCAESWAQMYSPHLPLPYPTRRPWLVICATQLHDAAQEILEIDLHRVHQSCLRQDASAFLLQDLDNGMQDIMASLTRQVRS